MEFHELIIYIVLNLKKEKENKGPREQQSLRDTNQSLVLKPTATPIETII